MNVSMKDKHRFHENRLQPYQYMSHLVGKPTICIGVNKGADQLRGNREADQRLCFRYSDSTTPLLLKSKISSFYLFSVLVQLSLCRTCSETTLLVFPRGGSYDSTTSPQHRKNTSSMGLNVGIKQHTHKMYGLIMTSGTSLLNST